MMFMMSARKSGRKNLLSEPENSVTPNSPKRYQM